jgi:hypothetical protein
MRYFTPRINNLLMFSAGTPASLRNNYGMADRQLGFSLCGIPRRIPVLDGPDGRARY